MQEAAGFSRGRKLTALGLLLLVGIANYVDKSAMSMLQVPVKADLGFSDTQLGTLTGIAFFVPFVLLSIPMARLADRTNRKYVLIAALTVWCTMTALLGLAGGFLPMVALRMGVAVGEACCLPACYSLISDYFRLEERGRAIAVFGMAYPIGSMVGMTSLGVLGAEIGWRETFLLVGAAGLLLVPVMMIFFEEPPRLTDATAVPAGPTPSLIGALAILWRLRTFRYGVIAAAVQALASYSVLTWSAPYYARAFGMDLAEIGVTLGLMFGVAGGASVFLGGFLADFLGRRDKRWYMWLPAVTCAAFLPFGLLQFVTPSLSVSLLAGTIAAVFSTMFLAPANALFQSLVRANMRATTSAVIATSSAVLGGAVGPFVIGLTSDWGLGQGASPAAALRLAVIGVLLTAGVAAALFAWAARYAISDLEGR